MVDNASNNENDGSVKGIAIGNFLGDGIRMVSLPKLGPGRIVVNLCTGMQP